MSHVKSQMLRLRARDPAILIDRDRPRFTVVTGDGYRTGRRGHAAEAAEDDVASPADGDARQGNGVRHLENIGRIGRRVERIALVKIIFGGRQRTAGRIGKMDAPGGGVTARRGLQLGAAEKIDDIGLGGTQSGPAAHSEERQADRAGDDADHHDDQNEFDGGKTAIRAFDF